ncbi:DGQHR domain-containing protein [Enterobacter roggenkampii]|uniref:DGQHR domain-containing protein n=1 Tax=Enterobacter roggenkampii TaxID=1812935 RepID=UPI002FD7E436
MSERESYGSVSLVRQGEHRFYSFTMPSDVLAESCFVVNREEDPNEGFQRELDKKRAAEIANYIDSGLGTIPSSIVLSAQEDCDFIYDSKKKSISFLKSKKAFLIIDGQHRVYGFKLAKTALRIPVVVYENLSKRDESRLFIDINSKQKGVPTELLLDIKKMAEYENDIEQYLRELFDTFSSENDSALYNRLSASKKERGMITRSVFNTAVKPLVKVFGNKNPSEVYEIFNSYLIAFNEGVLLPNQLSEQAFNSTVFKAIAGFFPIITARVKDRFGAIYSVDNYYEFTQVVGQRIKPAKIENPSNAYKPIIEHLEESLKLEFTL